MGLLGQSGPLDLLDRAGSLGRWVEQDACWRPDMTSARWLPCRPPGPSFDNLSRWHSRVQTLGAKPGRDRRDFALPDANAVNDTHSSCAPSRLTSGGGTNADTVNPVHSCPARFTGSGDHAVQLLNGRKREVAAEDDCQAIGLRGTVGSATMTVSLRYLHKSGISARCVWSQRMLDWVATKILALMTLVPPLLSPDGEHFLLVRSMFGCCLSFWLSAFCRCDHFGLSCAGF